MCKCSVPPFQSIPYIFEFGIFLLVKNRSKDSTSRKDFNNKFDFLWNNRYCVFVFLQDLSLIKWYSQDSYFNEFLSSFNKFNFFSSSCIRQSIISTKQK